MAESIIAPRADGLDSLGDESRNWKQVYAKKVVCNGTDVEESLTAVSTQVESGLNTLSYKLDEVISGIPTKVSQLTNDSNYAVINSSGHLVINGSEIWVE